MDVPAQSPKIHGLCVVKNEQDIIEPFVRHNLKFLNSLAVLDNGSVDATKHILKQLSREFNNLFVAHDDRFGHTQSDRMTRMFREARSASPSDYVMALDGDEFISVAEGSEVGKVFQQIPAGGCGLVPWRTFVLTPGAVSMSDADPPRSLQWRRCEESPVFYKVILPSDGQFDYDLIIPIGNHVAVSASGREVPSVHLDNLSLMHFPVRSRDQFIAKTVVGWMAHLSRDPKARESEASWHRRGHFDRIADGLVIDDETLCEISFLYAQTLRPIDWQSDVVREDPQFDYVRRYSTGRALGSVELIARSWEQSILGRSPRPSLNEVE